MNPVVHAIGTKRADNKFGEFILSLKISNINIIQVTGTEKHIYAHTVANPKYPSNPNHAKHIV
jgi:hypothetical protein